jgi:hypothetical protein
VISLKKATLGFGAVTSVFKFRLSEEAAKAFNQSGITTDKADWKKLVEDNKIPVLTKKGYISRSFKCGCDEL